MIDIREIENYEKFYWEEIYFLENIKHYKVSNVKEAKKYLKPRSILYFVEPTGYLLDVALVNKAKELKVLFIFPLSRLKNSIKYLYMASKILNRKKPFCLFVSGARSEEEIKNPLEVCSFFEVCGIKVNILNIKDISLWKKYFH
jgi:hypothetical protein